VSEVQSAAEALSEDEAHARESYSIQENGEHAHESNEQISACTESPFGSPDENEAATQSRTELKRNAMIVKKV